MTYRSLFPLGLAAVLLVPVAALGQTEDDGQ